MGYLFQLFTYEYETRWMIHGTSSSRRDFSVLVDGSPPWWEEAKLDEDGGKFERREMTRCIDWRAFPRGALPIGIRRIRKAYSRTI